MQDMISIQLTPAQWNIVGASLGKQPYEVVRPVIAEIERQFAVHEAAKAAERPAPKLVQPAE